VVFEATTDSPLALMGAVFKTDGSAPPLNASNFVPAVDGEVTIPLNQNTTRGVILIFAFISNTGEILMLFPTSDPQITNVPK
jgi:hypothetical protein